MDTGPTSRPAATTWISVRATAVTSTWFRRRLLVKGATPRMSAVQATASTPCAATRRAMGSARRATRKRSEPAPPSRVRRTARGRHARARGAFAAAPAMAPRLLHAPIRRHKQSAVLRATATAMAPVRAARAAARAVRMGSRAARTCVRRRAPTTATARRTSHARRRTACACRRATASMGSTITEMVSPTAPIRRATLR